jgi:hypothetical protein
MINTNVGGGISPVIVSFPIYPHICILTCLGLLVPYVFRSSKIVNGASFFLVCSCSVQLL